MNQSNQSKNILVNNKMTGLQKIEDYGATWYLGKSEDQPLISCIKNAESLKHKFIVAYDYFKVGMTRPTKVYGSYKNSRKFYKQTKEIESNQRCFYVIVPENTGCCLFADLEWDLSWKSVDDIKQKFMKVVGDTLKSSGVELDSEEYLFSNACDEATNKGSLHVHVPCIYFKNIKEQQRFFNAVHIELDKESNEWFFIEESDKSYILKTFIDFGVYNKNRQIRLPYSSKMKKNGFGVRPLIPTDEENFDFQQWTITDLDECDDDPVDVSSYPAEIGCSKRNLWSKELVQGIVDELGLDVSVDTFKGNNLISLRNKKSIRTCPINGEENKSDNAYLVIRDNKLHYYCHNEECKGCSKVIHEFKEESNYMYPEPPFKKYYWEFQEDPSKYVQRIGKMTVITEEGKEFQKRFIEEINQYCVWITGSAKTYILYRTEIVRDGHKSVQWIAKHIEPFISTYMQYETFLSGSKCYVMSPLTKRYLNEDCRPYEKPSDCPVDVFNTFQGLAIDKETSMTKGKSDPTKLLDFIKNNWCDSDVGLFNWVMDWMAHLIQKPWIKMKTSIVLQGSEGTGKGMIVQLLGKIIGNIHFFQPSSQDDMFGSFNYMMDNRLLCFADEMFWGGDKKNAGQLKKLLTEESRCSNTKYGPIRRLTNMINWIFASNEDWVVPAGVRARRYTVLKVGDGLYNMNKSQKKELYDFCAYSFAKYLYNRDINNFNPHQMYKTQGLAEQKVLSMPPVHKFWMGYIEDNKHKFGTWVMKNDIYSEFMASNAGGYKVNDRVFWMGINKIQPLDCKQKKHEYTGKQCRYILLPQYQEAIDTFNKLYDCTLVYDVPEEYDDSNNDNDNDNDFFSPDIPM